MIKKFDIVLEYDTEQQHYHFACKDLGIGAGGNDLKKAAIDLVDLMNEINDPME
jgi:hypothetical protein